MTTDGRQPAGPVGETPEEIPPNALRILEAAVTLFSRKGYAATSVREIVQEAQVTNPMLYYYFDSKEGLFTALTELMHREFLRDLSNAIDKSAGLEEALEQVVEIHMRAVRETPDVLRFVYSLLFGADGSCPAHQLYESHHEVLDLLSALFDRAVPTGFVPAFDPVWLVHQLLGLINSHSMRLIKELEYVEEDEREAWLAAQTDAATVRRLVRFFLNGASTRIEI